MITTTPLVVRHALAATALLGLLGSANSVIAAEKPGKPKAPAPAPPVESSEPDAPAEAASSSVEQGRTLLSDSFEERRQWRLEKRMDALRDTEFKFNLRAFYFSRDKFDGTRSEAFAVGGWAGLKTGYFLDHISFGITGYTSQHLSGDIEEDGTLLLAPGQEGYSVLGELYADIRIVKDLNLYVGRKEFDTPFINRNDVRMTPNTFEAIVLQGRIELGKGGTGPGKGSTDPGKDVVEKKEEGGAILKYGLGYFDKIKERNSDEFISMATDAGADGHRGVFTAGVLYEKGKFSIGAIDYYCPDLLNIAYAEAKMEFAINDDLKPRLAVQFTDQRSVGDNLLQEDDYSAQQFGIKAELPVKSALFTLGYTQTTDGANMQNPWSGYPGYTSVQVQDFNRSGEGAFLIRAGYDFTAIKGLSAYALAVLGTDPGTPGQYRHNEYDFNVQWAPPEGVLKGLSLRVRYALVQQDGGDVNDLQDFRVICNYSIKF